VLRIMAHDILAIPASSVPCERAFSGAKHTDTDDRNRLLPEHLGAIQITKADMLRWRDVKKEEKKILEWEKLEQWHEHESKTIVDQAGKLGIIHTI
jgi:hAT family C-terminal dimerisation region